MSRSALVLLAVGMFLIPSRASVQEDNALSEEAIALADLDVAELQELSEQGIANAQRLLGFIYQDDEFVSQDNVEALRWSLQAATQGGANAQFEVAGLYRYVLEDFVRAHMWFNLAAAQGHVGAMNQREQVQPDDSTTNCTSPGNGYAVLSIKLFGL